MITKSSGSATLLVLLIMTVLTVAALNALKNRLYMHELACKQQVYEQQFWATDALLKYGIAWCKQNAEGLTSEQQMTFEQWPLHNPMYAGELSVVPGQEHIRLRAQLYDQHHQAVCVLSCRLVQAKKGDEQRWVIHDWKIE